MSVTEVAVAPLVRCLEVGQECLGSLVARPSEYLARFTLLDDVAAVDEDDPVGDVSGEWHLVGHQHHRHAVPGELAHDAQHLAGRLRIQSGCRLIEEQDRGLQRQGTGDRDPLLLPAGHLSG